MLAAAGMPADIVPANFRRGARYAWTALLAAAREDERAGAARERRPAVRVHRPRLASCSPTPTGPPGRRASSRRRSAAPEALLARASPARSRTARTSSWQSGSASSWAAPTGRSCWWRPARTVQRHLAFAGAPAGRHVLAVSEGRRVAGLAHAQCRGASSGSARGAVIARGRRTRRAELARRSTSCAWWSTLAVAPGPARARSRSTTTWPSCCCAARRDWPRACGRASTTARRARPRADPHARPADRARLRPRRDRRRPAGAPQHAEQPPQPHPRDHGPGRRRRRRAQPDLARVARPPRAATGYAATAL